ncbi:MAG: hypothetical protein IJK38_06005, partial [Oscillospiraceae bacterium]|nr:hypothetical protein [Oscillospiraceae bacterium]
SVCSISIKRRTRKKSRANYTTYGGYDNERAVCKVDACFAAAVFLIADGHFWNGVVFIGAGASLSSAAVIYKKKNNASDGDHKTK